MKRIALLFLLTILSCSKDFRVSDALKMAESNRDELEAVLCYFQNLDDEDKLNAAKYIVMYMPGHKSMSGEYDSYYNAADSILCGDGVTEAIMRRLHDLSLEYTDKIDFSYDIHRIKSEFLINDIDRAVEQWRTGDWAKHLSFDEFCEWLLPYTCSNAQPIFDWRDSLKEFAGEDVLYHLNECEDYLNNPRAAIIRVNNGLKSMITKQNWIHSDHGYPIFRPEVFIKLPGARCDEYAELAVLVMRSKGIPVTIDFTPQWPNRQHGHYWCVFPTLRGKTSLFNPFESNPDSPHFSNSQFAKVYRRTYKPNEEYIELIKRNNGHVPLICGSPFFQDVTDEYMKTINLTVKLYDKAANMGKDVYIAVFDNQEWKPVAWGKRKGKRAHFENMGKGITYIVSGYVNDRLIPLSSPFKVDYLGNIEYLEKDNDEKTSFRLFRKFPMFQHVFIQQSKLQGGRIEASNAKDFSDFEVVATFPDWTLTSGKQVVSQVSPYRYWRFCPDEDMVSDVAELYFYHDSVSCPITGFAAFCQDSTFNNMFDSDPLTYYSATSTDELGYCDFGEPITIEHVSYIRRGDGNAIVPGDDYEIYYWSQGQWILHSSIQASDISIDVTGIPSERLYYIKGLSRGVQDRIFTWCELSNQIEWH